MVWNQEIFWQAVIEKKKALGLSWREYAELLGIRSQSTIRHWSSTLKRPYSPSQENLAKFYFVFGDEVFCPKNEIGLRILEEWNAKGAPECLVNARRVWEERQIKKELPQPKDWLERIFSAEVAKGLREEIQQSLAKVANDKLVALRESFDPTVFTVHKESFSSEDLEKVLMGIRGLSAYLVHLNGHMRKEEARRAAEFLAKDIETLFVLCWQFTKTFELKQALVMITDQFEGLEELRQ